MIIWDSDHLRSLYHWIIFRIIYRKEKFDLQQLCQVSFNSDNIRFWAQICPKQFKRQKLWKDKCQNQNPHKTMYVCTKFSSFKELSILGRDLPKKIEWKKNWNNKCQKRNRLMAMYYRLKFQVIWRTSDFGTKFAQKK